MSTDAAQAFLLRQPMPDGTEATDWKPWCEAIRPALAQQFPQVNAATLIRARSDLIDAMLQRLWCDYRLHQIPGLALLAIGGYGRAQLHPYSDIDVLFLYPKTRPHALTPFIQLLWDSGLALAQSVRTVPQCRQDARNDIKLMTSWLEMRLLCGDVKSAQALEKALKTSSGLFGKTLWAKDKFFFGKIDEQTKRHQQYGGSAYRLEPNIKNGPGGLRDIQTIRWILKRHEGIDSPNQFCTDTELALLCKGEQFLWKVRFTLHEASGKAEERLLFDHQHAIAQRLGYDAGHINRTIEAFMQDYYRLVGKIERLNEVLTQQYREDLQGHRRRPPKPLGPAFQVSSGFLEMRRKDTFQQRPQALMELFLILQQHPKIEGVRASTIRAVRTHLYLIDEAFRNNLTVRTLFMEILRQPLHVARELRRMHRYEVLPAYWPDLSRTVGRMQYDLFHIYPVDEHTLQVLTELRHITKPQTHGEDPLYHELFQQFPKPELLYLAALCHDIGKGQPGDHSETGAMIAREFCLKHQLSTFDAGIVQWLVQHHLLMSITAQKRDLSDPQVVHDFAVVVGNGTRLRGLFLLTVADLRGTNPALWTPWRSALLHQLYLEASKLLQRGLDQPTDTTELLQDLKSSALALIPGIDEQACRQFWDTFADSELLHYTDDTLAWQTLSILNADRQDEAQAFVRHQGTHHCTEVLLYADQDTYLFTPVTSTLARMGMNVLYARIASTLKHKMLVTFLVTDAQGQAFSEGRELNELHTTLQQVLRDPHHFDRPVKRLPSRRASHFKIPTSIKFVQRDIPSETRIELTTGNHFGLLWVVSDTLNHCKVRISQACINTLGEQVRDVFTITDAQSRPLQDPEMQAQVTAALQERISKLDPTPAKPK